jgi:CRISPR-associated protein Csc2
MLAEIPSLEKFAHRFSPSVPPTPTGRWVSVVLLRETKSYAIFTTEGGERQDTETTQAGRRRTEPVDRLVMFKRKQVAPERRTGKALLRQYGAFPHLVVKQGTVLFGDEALRTDEKRAVKDCSLIEHLCTHCPDCLTYGYAAVEGEGSRKARVFTDSCFSVRPYAFLQRAKKFNVIDERRETSGTITEFDHTGPEVVLPSLVATVDLTADEFVYVLGNLLHTTRYGKEVSRQGFVRNHVVALAFSDVEPFANLELTQAFYDAFLDAGKDLVDAPLSRYDFEEQLPKVLEELSSGIAGRLQWLTGEVLATVLSEVRSLYGDEERVRTFLLGLTQASIVAAQQED